MMIDNGIMDIDGSTSIEVLLWVCKPSKQATQTITNSPHNIGNSIILTVKRLYVGITTTFSQLQTCNNNPLHNYFW